MGNGDASAANGLEFSTATNPDPDRPGAGAVSIIVGEPDSQSSSDPPGREPSGNGDGPSADRDDRADHAGRNGMSMLEAFAGKQRLLLAICEEKGHGVDWANEDLISADDSEEGLKELTDVVLSVAGSRSMNQGTELAELLILKAHRVAETLSLGSEELVANWVEQQLQLIDNLVAMAKPRSALVNFQRVWHQARGRAAGDGEGELHFLSRLAFAAAADDLETVQRFPREFANAPMFPREFLPGTVQRRPNECSLLSLAVGADSIKVVRWLFESPAVIPTRETL
jgi:hypothetical protein